APLRGLQSFSHQHGHGEQTNATRHRCSLPSYRIRFRRMHVADESVASFRNCLNSLAGLVAKELARLPFIAKLVYAALDYCRAPLDVSAPDQRRTADRGNQDVGLSRHAGQVPGARMADRDSGVSLE